MNKQAGIRKLPVITHRLVALKLSLHTSQVAHQAGACLSFSSMKLLGVLVLPLDVMLIHRRVTPPPPPSIKFACTHLYT